MVLERVSLAGRPLRENPRLPRGPPFGEGAPEHRRSKPASRQAPRGGAPGGRKGEGPEEVFPQTTPGGTVIWARAFHADGEPIAMIETEGGAKTWKRVSEIT
jgi:hypothetical protein